MNERSLLTDTISQKKQTTKTTEHWRCANTVSYKCRMLAVTARDELVSAKNEHSHDLRRGKFEANQITHQMKKEARQQILPVNSSITATCFQEVTDRKAAHLSLPNRSAKQNSEIAINRTWSRPCQSIKTGIS